MTRTIETKPFDAAKYLKTDEQIAGFMSEALATGDPAFIAHSLGVVARAKGMTDLARTTGLSRESLYRALSEEGSPELGTVMKVIGALGLRLAAEPAEVQSGKKKATPRQRTAAGSARTRSAA